MKQSYRPDLVCYEKIIVELKALRELTGEHRSQVLNYLKATGLRLGLLVNFGLWLKGSYCDSFVCFVFFVDPKPGSRNLIAAMKKGGQSTALLAF